MGKKYLARKFEEESGKAITEQREVKIKPEKPHPFLLRKGKI